MRQVCRSWCVLAECSVRVLCFWCCVEKLSSVISCRLNVYCFVSGYWEGSLTDLCFHYEIWTLLWGQPVYGLAPPSYNKKKKKLVCRRNCPWTSASFNSSPSLLPWCFRQPVQHVVSHPPQRSITESELPLSQFVSRTRSLVLSRQCVMIFLPVTPPLLRPHLHPATPTSTSPTSLTCSLTTDLSTLIQAAVLKTQYCLGLSRLKG